MKHCQGIAKACLEKIKIKEYAEVEPNGFSQVHFVLPNVGRVRLRFSI
jgi:hypothetical protein